MSEYSTIHRKNRRTQRNSAPVRRWSARELHHPVTARVPGTVPLQLLRTPRPPLLPQPPLPPLPLLCKESFILSAHEEARARTLLVVGNNALGNRLANSVDLGRVAAAADTNAHVHPGKPLLAKKQ